MQMVGPAFMDWVLNERVAGPLGNRHPAGAAAPHGVFPCAGDDRWISLAVFGDEEWRALVAAMDDPEWARAAAYASHEGRLAALDALHEQLAAWTAGHEARALAERLQARGLCAAPVLGIADLLDDPHWRARRTFVEVEHPLGFRETIYGAYVKPSRSEPAVRPGPAMGQDNERVFQGLLGLAPERYAQLVEEQVIY